MGRKPVDGRTILGIQIGHDASAAIVRGGRIVAAAAEERFSRVKFHHGIPKRAIEACLHIAGLPARGMDEVAFAMSEIPAKYLEKHSRNTEELRNALTVFRSAGLSGLISRSRIEADLGLQRAEYRWYDHHQAHAASAYFTSGWNECLAVTIDATDGELCATVNVCADNTITRLAQTSDVASPGYFYAFVTELLGYKRLRHEGKITGLAAYDDGERLYDELSRVIKLGDSDNHFVPGFDPATEPHEIWRYTPLAVPKSVLARLRNARPEEVAAAAQRVLEDLVSRHVAAMCRRTGQSRVALAGGVFANVKLNQRILELDEVAEIYVHPNMGDGGLAAGAALQAYAEGAKPEERFGPYRLQDVYLGTQYSREKIRSAVERSGERFAELDEVEPFVAQLLAEGRVVGWFDGAMEYGPRALGNRSILAAPTDRSINDWLNEKLQRTEFMPFAPAVLDRSAAEIFANYRPGAFAAEYMTVTFDVKPEWRERIPAVVHVDGTARPQVVAAKTSPAYYRIIEEYERLTGLPVILNTSFNVHEEPIVESPGDALRAFVSSRLDAVVMGGLVVSRDPAVLERVPVSYSVAVV